MIRKFNLSVPNIINKTLVSLTQAATGIAKSERKDVWITLGCLAQRIIAGQQLQALSGEWEALKKKGKIKEEYEKSREGQYCLLELLNFLDEPIPDEDRFQILKKIFLVAATEEVYSRDSIKPLQYMKLVKTLSSGEIIVLLATYKLSKNSSAISHSSGSISAEQWLDPVAKESGLIHNDLVANFEEDLMTKRLISPREYSDKSGVRLGQNFRLTNLGLDLCEFVAHYDKVS